MNNIYRMMGALNSETELETLANLTRKLGLAARPRMSVLTAPRVVRSERSFYAN
jgi:hypothetical protein